jgi:hypothetical protein
MRKLICFQLVFVLLLSFNQVAAQGDAEKTAKEVIEAYKNEDFALLKKHLTGMMLNVIDDDFFESDDGKPLVEIAQQWDGTIKEIRYEKNDMMGNEVLLASAYFSDNPNGNLNVVLLSSFDQSDWKAFASGLTDISKEEYEKAATSMEATAEKKEPVAEVAANRSDYSIEMATGDIIEGPTDEKVKESLKTLDDDNFFMTLNGKDDFLQTTISEKGYIVQHGGGDDGMFEADDFFTFEQLVDIFIAYINEQNWKEMANWNEM